MRSSDDCEPKQEPIKPGFLFRFAAGRTGVIFIAALIMAWPALYNGYPLLYADSMTYLQAGPLVAQALFHRQFSDDYGARSFIYSLGILPLHAHATLWSIVALNAVLTAYVIWLTVRSIFGARTSWRFLALVVPLSAFTGLSWTVAWVMPDIFGPALYLSIYLLVFARAGLSRKEYVIVILIAWWSMASHITHLLLAAAFCVFLVFLRFLTRRAPLLRLRAVGVIAMLVVTAAAAHAALHWYLYGKPSLNGKAPPYVLARVVADGPAKRYLQQHCGELHFQICARLSDLPDDAGDFLWREQGIWSGASAAERDRLRDEQAAIVLGTLREYPREELVLSAKHFWEQLHTFGLSDYDADPWILEMSGKVSAVSQSGYLQSLQANEDLPDDLFARMQNWTVLGAVVVIAISLVAVRSRVPRIIGLIAVVLFAVVANAAVTGILSNVEDRYQARVIWLVPLLAGVLVLNWAELPRTRTGVSGPFSLTRTCVAAAKQTGNAGLIDDMANHRAVQRVSPRRKICRLCKV